MKYIYYLSFRIAFLSISLQYSVDSPGHHGTAVLFQEIVGEEGKAVFCAESADSGSHHYHPCKHPLGQDLARERLCLDLCLVVQAPKKQVLLQMLPMQHQIQYMCCNTSSSSDILLSHCPH